MLDDSGDFGGKAAEEIKEEVGLCINKADLFNMSAAAVKHVDQPPSTPLDGEENTFRERLQDSMYPSPGGCDEFLPLMLLQKRMRRGDLEDLQARTTGLRDEGEVITLKVVPFSSLWREGGRDAKCLAALGLYENLKREGGMLPAMPSGLDEQTRKGP
jgi:ADP-sugar diphosphatase